ncbi:hypothetical protein LRP52_10545 [Photobacterium sp. ZSDE20]|uniref:YtkA-like domain-containing protein n=1 Tax=Photobacterium pectinilyticum TaxID=2906793 RepID=A0ABT1N0A5_9GAMM|nr:hypothetical protein [Photobacterium sp. ZSDE20]MCQ1058099.1 hypothetical protein [Photobacterium sp. ZSDE20]MDD1822632.1 hypothetical protein [Photobacterium sp. ZSDE20]
MIWSPSFIIFFSVFFHNAFAKSPENNEAVSEFGWMAQRVQQAEDLPLNQIHSWQLMITDDKGVAMNCSPQPVRGGMPAHRHGLPTQPQWHHGKEAGSYRIDGLKFQMPGLWQVVFSCKDDRERDHEFTFEFIL